MVKDMSPNTGEFHYFLVKLEFKDGVIFAEGGESPPLRVREDVGDLFSNTVVREGGTYFFKRYATLTSAVLIYYSKASLIDYYFI